MEVLERSEEDVLADRLGLDAGELSHVTEIGKHALNTRLEWCEERGIPYAVMPMTPQIRADAIRGTRFNVLIEVERAWQEQHPHWKPDRRSAWLIRAHTNHTNHDLGSWMLRVFDGEKEITDAEFGLINLPPRLVR